MSGIFSFIPGTIAPEQTVRVDPHGVRRPRAARALIVLALALGFGGFAPIPGPAPLARAAESEPSHDAATPHDAGRTLAAAQDTGRPHATSPDPLRPLSLARAEARGPGRPLWRQWIDLDGDGRLDLIVLSASSSAPAPSGGDQVADLVAYMRVTPDFLDRRQLLLYRQTQEGLARWGEPLPLTGDTAAVDVADIDGDGREEILYAAGFATYAFSRTEGAATFAPEARLLARSPLLVGHTRAFVPKARLAATLAPGLGSELLLPTPAGIEVRLRKTEGGYEGDPDAVIRNPLRSVRFARDLVLIDEPVPDLTDADGDGTLDLLFVRGGDMALVRGLGGGRFEREPLRRTLPGEAAQQEGDEGGREDPGSDRQEGSGIFVSSQTALADINGDGRLDYLRNGDGAGDSGQEGAGKGGAGQKGSARHGSAQGGSGQEGADGPPGSAETKPEKKKAKESSSEENDEPGETRVLIHLGRAGFGFEEKPDTVVRIPEKEKIGGALARPLRIDGDRRADLLVTRFSVGFFQLARVMMTKKISIKIQFESMLQRPDGSFAPSRGTGFETKITIDLKRGIESSPTAVRGDYNGDGITDLIEFTDRPAALIHLTTPEGEFPARAALSVPLPRSPDDSALLDIEDLDGDGRSDIAFFSPDGDGFVMTLLRSNP